MPCDGDKVATKKGRRNQARNGAYEPRMSAPLQSRSMGIERSVSQSTPVRKEEEERGILKGKGIRDKGARRVNRKQKRKEGGA